MICAKSSSSRSSGPHRAKREASRSHTRTYHLSLQLPSSERVDREARSNDTMVSASPNDSYSWPATPPPQSRTVRQAAYRTLSLWCATIKHGSLVETIAEDLIKAILPDVTPFHAEVTLKVLAGSRKYLSKKARQRLNKAQNQASNLVQTHSKAFNPHNTRIVYSDSGNEALCASALACLTAVLRAAGCFLKPTLQKVLQENIVALAFGVVNTQPKPSSLYASVEARGALYVALYALVQCPHHLCPPPLQYAVEIFRSAQNSDGSAGIRHKCNDFLRALEKTLHPQKETLFFPTDVTEINEAFERDAAAAAQKGVDSGSDSDSEVCFEYMNRRSRGAVFD